MKFFHIEDGDIYVIDYSGTISLDIGISNMSLIEKEIRELSKNKKCLRLILDIRNTIWESREVHNALSEIARTKFNPNNFNFVIYTAILNNEINGSTFENEYWFLKKEDAIKWLVEKCNFI
jgi:hypothetical protein